MPSEPATPITVDVFSDVVCPWCFIGKRRLEKAIALKPEIPVEVRYQPYFLNPWVPREGISRDEYLTTKFGSPDKYAQIAQRVAATAKSEGLIYNIGGLARQPNTIDCQRLIQWAQSIGRGPEMKQRLMDLYFTEGGDLTDREVLVKAAADCGLDAEAVRKALATDADVAEITKAAEAAQQSGIQGVPFFIIGGKYAVSGAQSPEHLAGAIEQAARELATV
jgi:predicted DsbA family dithiol-disulfide isomerase